MWRAWRKNLVSMCVGIWRINVWRVWVFISHIFNGSTTWVFKLFNSNSCKYLRKALALLDRLWYQFVCEWFNETMNEFEWTKQLDRSAGRIVFHQSSLNRPPGYGPLICGYLFFSAQIWSICVRQTGIGKVFNIAFVGNCFSAKYLENGDVALGSTEFG